VDWVPDWRGETVAVVASGESATQEHVDRLRGRCKVIVVNNNYQRAPWADLLYAADTGWWEHHRKDALQFAGLKVTPSRDFALHHKLHLVELIKDGPLEASQFVMDPKGTLGRGGHGGFQAFNLAAQTKPRLLLLLGLDLKGEHWHGRHPSPLRNPWESKMANWAKIIDAQAPILAEHGIEVVNCSAVSMLQAYPKRPIETVLP
jgi:hypothetical protein